MKPKKNIVIAGAGFAGISALKHLLTKRRFLKYNFKIILIDIKDDFEFIPMLPDIIAGWLKADNIRISLRGFCKKHNVDFYNKEIARINFPDRSVYLSSGEVIKYEYLVLATGSHANFFQNENLEKNCFKLDNIKDAEKIRDFLTARAASGLSFNVVISGGGYTGIEAATNANFLLKKTKAEYKIYIVEKSLDILPVLSDKLRVYIKTELQSLGIEILTKDSLQKIENNTAIFESGLKIENAVCIWTAGVKTADFIDKVQADKTRTRLEVDEFLRPKSDNIKNVFVAGDSANFISNEQPLRMAIMFSIGQGKTAAENIINSIKQKNKQCYKPLDLGYLIPMAQGKAAGKVLGKSVKGSLGYLLHYYMCLYRSENSNKPGILRDIIGKLTF